MNIKVLEAYETLNCQDQKNKTTLRHIIIKTLNIQNKQRILKAAKEKRLVTYKDNFIRIAAVFSTQTLNSRKSWKDIFYALKESNDQPRVVYPAKLSFLIEGEMKTFHNKKN
jgi:hypothetical protein